MSEIRKSWVMYDSFLEVANMMPTPEERDQMILAIVHMGFYDEIPEDLPLHMRTALRQMLESVRSAKSRHDVAIENGKKGGAPKGNQNAKGHGAPKGNSNAKKTNNQNNPNDNVNVNVNVNDNYIMATPIDLFTGQGSPIYKNADDLLNDWRNSNE